MKAMFLLVVFSLNTIAGFACSIGVDMGYNTKHHSHDHGKSGHTAKHAHSHKHNHTHSHKAGSGLQLKAAKDDCCSDQVNDFTKMEKSLPANDFLLQAPSFLISNDLFEAFAKYTEIGPTVNSRFQFVRRSCFLNDINLQTAIRRYQI